ncbi:MAG: hypothetical protein Q7R47_04445, partial [Candidatus Diapherotrites archaeon]|nr:hypothetical protein [Candidatus Diapherotrites archaeon]
MGIEVEPHRSLVVRANRFHPALVSGSERLLELCSLVIRNLVVVVDNKRRLDGFAYAINGRAGHIAGKKRVEREAMIDVRLLRFPAARFSIEESAPHRGKNWDEIRCENVARDRIVIT